MTTPDGFDGFFFDTGEPAGARTVLPPASEPPDLNALVAADRNGVAVVGPAPAPTTAG